LKVTGNRYHFRLDGRADWPPALRPNADTGTVA
jgi:hypothetical protein